MPLAIIIGMCSIALIYLAVNVSYFTILDVQDFLDSPAVAQVLQFIKTNRKFVLESK